MEATRCAIGLIRVSKVGDRKGDRFVSPKDQQARIERFCAEHNITLLETVYELDVSGGSSMLERTRLDSILGDIEARRCGADSLVVAYFDRLARSTEVGQEVMRRLVAARGHLYVAEEGAEQKIDTPDAWFIFTVKMATAELYRRQAGTKTHAAKVNAIARGVPTFANIPPGYVRTAAGPLEPDVLAPVMVRAYELRDKGASWNQVRAHLRAHGIRRSLRGTVNLLSTRIYLGELHFGELVNLTAHEPIVDFALWTRVQQRLSVRGRYSETPRLLARLGVLKCGNCGSALHVGSQSRKGVSYPDYRCPGRSAGLPCENSVSIQAPLLEAIVVERARADLGKRAGTLDAEQRVVALSDQVQAAEAERDTLVVAFDPVKNTAVAMTRIADAQAKVNELAARLAAARADADPVFHTYVDTDWDNYDFETQRRLIRASFCAIEVHSGYGRDRVRFFSTGHQAQLV